MAIDWRLQRAANRAPLEAAARLQAQAARQGFDWDAIAPMWDKLDEEIAELRAAVEAGDADASEAELGDVLFMLVNLARRLQLEPARALQRTNGKFLERMRHMQAALTASGRRIEDCGIDELEALWQAAKRTPPAPAGGAPG